MGANSQDNKKGRCNLVIMPLPRHIARSFRYKVTSGNSCLAGPWLLSEFLLVVYRGKSIS